MAGLDEDQKRALFNMLVAFEIAKKAEKHIHPSSKSYGQSVIQMGFLYLNDDQVQALIQGNDILFSNQMDTDSAKGQFYETMTKMKNTDRVYISLKTVIEAVENRSPISFTVIREAFAGLMASVQFTAGWQRATLLQNLVKTKAITETESEQLQNNEIMGRPSVSLGEIASLLGREQSFKEVKVDRKVVPKAVADEDGLAPPDAPPGSPDAPPDAHDTKE